MGGRPLPYHPSNLFQDPASYSQANMLPCSNHDLFESPGVVVMYAQLPDEDEQGRGSSNVLPPPPQGSNNIPVCYALQDHWNYRPERGIPCNNIDLRESPPIRRWLHSSKPLPETEDTPSNVTWHPDHFPPSTSLHSNFTLFEDEAQGRDVGVGGSRATNKRKQAAATNAPTEPLSKKSRRDEGRSN